MGGVEAMKKGIVLFAHGSRDPLWSQAIERIANAASKMDAEVLVRCAYLELMQPTLKHAAQDLIAHGVLSIQITPLFLGVGKHAREDLPVLVAELSQLYPHIHFDLRPSIGEHPLVVQTIASIVTQSDMLVC